MQYDIDGGNITVVVGEEARMDVPTALNYIKSGQDEIEATVNAGIDAFDLNAANKTTDFNDNASAKVTAFNDNATDKTDAFDLNASGKTNDFNDNYTIKKGLIDASVDAAAGSASAASASADLAQQWAVKMDGKVADEDYSAKYYADLASQSAGATGANKDLSNLTAEGEAKFDAKQDVIDSSHKLSASLVSGLANVATSGAYSDLSGKPSLATVATTGAYSDLSDTPNLSVYAADNAVVHLAGDETITGDKTFSGHVKLTERTDYPDAGLLISNNYPGYAISIQDTSCTKGVAPDHRKYASIDFYGTKKDGYMDRLGLLECSYNTNKETRLSIGAYLANNASDTTVSTIDVIYPASGNPFTKAPASDVNGSIVTTVNKNKAKNGYFKLGNGLIVQWGDITATSAYTTVTLPTPFNSATSYSVTTQIIDVDSVNPIIVRSKTATSFEYYRYGGGNFHINWIAIGY